MKNISRYRFSMKRSIPDGDDEANGFCDGYWKNFHPSFCKGVHKCCTDRCFRTLGPWHNCRSFRTDSIPFAGWNHKCWWVDGTFCRRSWRGSTSMSPFRGCRSSCPSLHSQPAFQIYHKSFSNLLCDTSFLNIVYHESFQVYWVLGLGIVGHNCSCQLRDIMAGVALAGHVDFSGFVTREPVHPSD